MFLIVSGSRQIFNNGYSLSITLKQYFLITRFHLNKFYILPKWDKLFLIFTNNSGYNIFGNMEINIFYF